MQGLGRRGRGMAMIALLAGMAAAIGLLAMGCEDILANFSGNGGSSFTDGRDGQTYKTVKIGSQTWMAANLNIETGNSWCYNNRADSCEKYGRLYDWETAQSVCPRGWKLPDAADWRKLTTAVGGRDTIVYNEDGGISEKCSLNAGKKLKSKSGWWRGYYGSIDNPNGTDDYGFSALPGGNHWPDGYSRGASGYGCWWTASVGSDGNVYYRNMNTNTNNVNEFDLDIGNESLSDGLSVRCVKK
jgi:uncharacterized protein (TIGR02145 family)